MTNLYVDGLLLTTSEVSLLPHDSKRSYNQSVIRIALFAVMHTMGLIPSDFTYTPLNGSDAGILVLSDGRTYRITAKDANENTIEGKRLILNGPAQVDMCNCPPDKYFTSCNSCSTHPAEDLVLDLSA